MFMLLLHIFLFFNLQLVTLDFMGTIAARVVNHIVRLVMGLVTE